MKQSKLGIAAILSAALIMACGGDPTHPGGGGGGIDLTGNYTATQWVMTGGAGQTDQIVAGSTLTITLNPNNTTSGHMHLVASGNNPAVDADLVGLWSQAFSTITFTQQADTFVRNMAWGMVANGPKWSLEGDQVFNGTRVQITLTQS